MKCFLYQLIFYIMYQIILFSRLIKNFFKYKRITILKLKIAESKIYEILRNNSFLITSHSFPFYGLQSYSHASEIIQQEACPPVVSHRLLILRAAINLKSEVVPLLQGHDESLFRLTQAGKKREQVGRKERERGNVNEEKDATKKD